MSRMFPDGESFTRRFWRVYVYLIGLVLLLFLLISIGLFGKLPSINEIENPQTAVSTEIYASDGVLLGKYYQQNRTNVSYENIPPDMVHALLATEDIRFHEHTGLDLKAIARAISGIVSHDSKGGGSTITQQLAKNLFPRSKSFIIAVIFRKFKEWVIAAKLERTYTKEEIIAMYLNTVEFSDNAFGINTAAHTYFNKAVDSLHVEEAAVLVGMLKAPYQYNPRLHPEASRRRRNIVLDQLYNYKYITLSQRDSLFKIPIKLEYEAESHEDGIAPYFRDYLRSYLKDYFDKHPKADGTKWNIYRSGLRIYTTIDSRMQIYAEEAQREHLTYWQKVFNQASRGIDHWREFPTEWHRTYTQCERYKRAVAAKLNTAQIDSEMNAPVAMRIFSWQGERDTVMSPHDSIIYYHTFLQNGFIAISPESGNVLAWVGGIGFKYFQYDHVNINTKRQIGSTFKPFVYTAAVRDKGYSPCYSVPNLPVTFERGDPRFHLAQSWTPKNSDGRYGGSYTLMEALAKSVNTVTSYLMHEMSVETVVKLAHEMGIKSEIPLQPSICLGAADISVIEMAGAYTTFANKGMAVEPTFLNRIEDRSGNVIAQFTAVRHEVLDESTTYAMVEMMRGVVRHGTGVRLRKGYGLTGDIIGKTGTTQNQSDGWFMGCTPDIVTACWVGCDDRFVRFRSIDLGQGASMALPITALFMQKVYSDSLRLGYSNATKFSKPEKLNIEMDCWSYYNDQKIDRAKDFGGEEMKEDTFHFD
jgi:penicillin-binding protein 1A